METEQTTADPEAVPAAVFEQNDARAIPVGKQLSIAVGILLLMFGTAYVDGAAEHEYPNTDTHVVPPATEPISVEGVEEAATTSDPFAHISITAQSAYIWDLTKQRALYNKNADMQWPLASVTKLMTALVAYELLEGDADVRIPVSAILQDGDSGLRNGEHFDLNHLTDFVLLTSSNDGAYALAEAAGSSLFEGVGGTELFIEAMNIRAEELGLSQTYFRNPTGLDESADRGGAYGSARDVAFLMEYIITTYPQLLEGTRASEVAVENTTGETHYAQNTNQFVTDIDGIIASKTGYTDLAGGNLVIAFDAGLNRPIIISVLGSTYAGRFEDILTLTAAARAAVAAGT